MMSPLRRRLCLEPLEDRCVPSVTITGDSAGNVTISGFPDTGSLNITATADATYTIDDGAAPGDIVSNLIVPGNLTVNMSSGNVNVNVNLNGFSTAASLTANFNAGTDTLFINGGTIAGNLQATSATNVTLVGTTVGGNVTVQDSAKNLSELVILFSSPVSGNLSVYTGTGSDVVALNSSPIGKAVNLSLSNGSNGFTQDSASTIESSLTVTSGAGDDIINLNGIIGGSAYLNLGGGTNTLQFEPTASVGASLTVLTGLGDDNINTFAGQVSGNIYLNLGDGNNTVDFTGSMGGTSFSYYGGAGVDSVTFDGNASRARLSFSLGAGADTLILTANARLASLWADFGPGSDTFTNQTGRVFPMTLLNLP